jgi:hypothetical protein
LVLGSLGIVSKLDRIWSPKRVLLRCARVLVCLLSPVVFILLITNNSPYHKGLPMVVSGPPLTPPTSQRSKGPISIIAMWLERFWIKRLAPCQLPITGVLFQVKMMQVTFVWGFTRIRS